MAKRVETSVKKGTVQETRIVRSRVGTASVRPKVHSGSRSPETDELYPYGAGVFVEIRDTLSALKTDPENAVLLADLVSDARRLKVFLHLNELYDGDAEKVRAFLLTPHTLLGGKTADEAMQEPAGLEAVEMLLGGLLYGHPV